MLLEAKSIERQASEPARRPDAERPEHVLGVVECREPWIGYLTVAPEQAARLLRFNTANRELNETIAGEYAAIVSAGEFEPTNQGIGFDRDGVLVDGQKRLAAIAAGVVPVVVAVAFGLRPSAFHAIDRGERRTIAQHFRAAGTLSGGATRTLEAATRLVWNHDCGRLPWAVRPTITPRQADATVARHPHLVDAAVDCRSHQGNPRMPEGAAAALLALFLEVDDLAASRFMDGARTGAGLDDGDPRLPLRASLTTGSRKTDAGAQAFMCRFVRAWNAWRKTRPAYALSGALDKGRFPEISGYRRPVGR